MPTIGVPTAEAMCVGPVSPDTITAAPRASAIDVADRRFWRHDRGAVSGRSSRFGEIFLTGTPQDHGHQPAPVPQLRSQRGEPIGRPALVRPGSAGIQQGIRPAGMRQRPARDVRVDVVDREFGPAGCHAERFEQSEIHLDDVPCLGRIVEPAASGIVRFRVEERAKRSRA